MCATMPAEARRPCTRPSALRRSIWDRTERIANSKSGMREFTRSTIAWSPWDRRRSQGSWPPGATATKVWAAKFWSSP